MCESISYNNFTIRPGKLNEIDQIYELVKSLRFEHDDLTDAYTMTAETLLHHWTIGFFDIDVLTNGEGIHGFLLYHKYFHQERMTGIYLAAYFVNKQFRGKGFGSEMIFSLLKKTLTMGKSFVCLMYHHIERFQFYKRFGFANEEKFTLFEKLTDNLHGFLMEQLVDYVPEKCGIVSITSETVTHHVTYPVKSVTCCSIDNRSVILNVQVNYCSWRGPVVFLNDLNASVHLLASPLLFHIVQMFLDEYEQSDQITDIWMDIPREEKDMHSFVEQQGFDNVTEDHWFRTCDTKESIKKVLQDKN